MVVDAVRGSVGGPLLPFSRTKVTMRLTSGAVVPVPSNESWLIRSIFTYFATDGVAQARYYNLVAYGHDGSGQVQTMCILSNNYTPAINMIYYDTWAEGMSGTSFVYSPGSQAGLQPMPYLRLAAGDYLTWTYVGHAGEFNYANVTYEQLQEANY